MMQDTILTMCKDSVKEFVKFMIQFIPTETQIISTSSVKNTFAKVAIENEEDQE